MFLMKNKFSHEERVERVTMDVKEKCSTQLSMNQMPKSELTREGLPDGACFNGTIHLSKDQMNQNVGEKHSTVSQCEYIGSFSVAGSDHALRAEYVRSQLESIKDVTKKKPVLLLISLSGIKVCSRDGKIVYMAHALRRISYATCDPEAGQFSFLAREPKGHFNLQYCHCFSTQTSQQAEELNTIVGNAFRMAFAHQLQKRKSSFRELIAEQLEQQKVRFQAAQQRLASSNNNSPAHQPHINLQNFHNEDNYSDSNKETHNKNSTGNRIWPSDVLKLVKQLVGKSKHKNPALERLDMNTPSGSPLRKQFEENGNGFHTGIAGGSGFQPRTFFKQFSSSKRGYSPPPPPLGKYMPLNLDASSPSSGGESSPTEMNIATKIEDKPPLIKRLSMPDETNNISGFPTIEDNNKPRPYSGYFFDDGDNGIRSSPVRDLEGYLLPKGSPSHNKKINGLKNRPLPSPPEGGEALLTESKRSSRSSGSPLLRETYSIQDPKYNPGYGKNGDRLSRIGTLSPPPPPERHDSLLQQNGEEMELKEAAWFQKGIPREIALEVLSREPVGAFMVRDSTSKPGCFALSLRVPREFHSTGIAHYLIMRTSKGYKIKGFTKEFPSLTALIVHHSVMPELLPCPLSLSRTNPAFCKNDTTDIVDIDEDPDYNTLSDFRKMMADLDV